MTSKIQLICKTTLKRNKLKLGTNMGLGFEVAITG